VFDDPSNPHIRNVTVSATTAAPTWFMRWFGMTATTVSSTGNAARRDVVAMMVLDRSGSMGTACSSLISAAKQFTGQFAAGRDQIGMVTFSDGVAPPIAPSTDFQTTLGYANAFGSATGALDSIKCNGGTSTPEAISIGYNELDKKSLVGALNILIVETDGLPNTVVYNWWDGTSYGIAPGSGCLDRNNRTAGGSGWTAGTGRNWFSGQSMNTGGSGYMSDIPAGTIGGLYASDPGAAQSFKVLHNPIQTSDTTTNNTVMITSTAPGCTFAARASTSISDFAWLPGTDVYGNSVNPGTAYKTVTTTGGHVDLTGTTSTVWTNIHNAALNATDHAAYRARTNTTLPVFVFTIGFTSSVDDVLLQRMANDPSWLPTATCTASAACANYTSQPQGRYAFAANTQELMKAFLSLSSQVLRLSQ
jgi:hypothetical protein